MTPEQRCTKYRKRILEISQQVTAAHVAPAFSCIEIVDLVYNHLMVDTDVFIMSKGHGCLAQYVVLEERGVLTREWLDNYCKPNGFLGAHPDLGVPGVEASTGSLGHGLGMAVGMAYAEKLKKSSVRIFCLLSDGECQEGSVWEAAMMAANLKLDNLVCFIDNNDYTGLDKLSEKHPAFYPLVGKFNAFGWSVMEAEGHWPSSLRYTSGVLKFVKERPSMFVCRTQKGRGVSYMLDNPIWHYRSPNKEEFLQAMRELDGESNHVSKN